MPATEVVIGFGHNDVAIPEDRDLSAKVAAGREMRVKELELGEDTGRSGANNDVLGIEEQRAALPQPCTGICPTAITQVAFAGHLDETARTARRTAAR